MEFNYSDYLVRITLNPVDIIVRFEHNTNFRSYEQTFFDRDFPEASFLGGLEFVGKALSTAFSVKPGDVSIDSFKKTTASLSFQVVISNPLFVSPMCLSFDLPAVRKDSGNLDVNVLNRKVKEMSEGFEPRLKKLQDVLESRLAVVDTLTLRLKEMEERCGDHIVIPGCGFAIPTHLQSIVIIKDKTSLPCGDCYSSSWPTAKAKFMCNSHGTCGLNYDNVTNNNNCSRPFTPSSNSFTFDTLMSIQNLKYLKKCTNVTLSGTINVQDYSVLGEMTGLTHLTIVSSRNFSNNQYGTGGNNAGNNPILTNISWVKNLKHLQSLTLLGCSSLSDITPLKDLPNLRELDIRETGVRNTDFLVNPNLKITK
jgi:hypothetical protein